LPLFWTAKVDLAESSCAMALFVGGNAARYFLPPELQGRSIYRPQARYSAERGTASMRVRKVLPPAQGGISVEATLITDERMNVTANDLIHVCLRIAGGRVDLYGHVDESEALAKGETRFRTIPQQLSPSERSALEELAGTSVPHATFEILPLLTSPCDMYALGVLAIRILLVDEENTLAVALDEMLSLAREIASTHTPDRNLGKRLQALFAKDARWAQSLGPRRLVRDAPTGDSAARIIPSDLWMETIGAIVRMFPGIGPDSYCRDLGDAPGTALEQIFDQPFDHFTLLSLRSRSLVLADWNQNLEIHDAIYEVIANKASRKP
jgi:hypothetical protein